MSPSAIKRVLTNMLASRVVLIERGVATNRRHLVEQHDALRAALEQLGLFDEERLRHELGKAEIRHAPQETQK